MEIWSKCDICGRDIPVGELCYGLKNGNCICKACCTGFENCTFTLAPAPTLTPPNEPLTIEQLREMNEEPVWLEIAGGVWGLIDTDDGCVWLNRGGSIDINKLDGKVYRRPPERQEEKYEKDPDIIRANL